MANRVQATLYALREGISSLDDTSSICQCTPKGHTICAPLGYVKTSSG